MTNILHIYTRVSSTAQQEEGTSLDNQKQLGIRKAQEMEFDFRLWNEGGQSSFHDDLNNRPILVSLLALIETGVVKHLFVYNADRLSRNQQTWAVIRFKLLKHGVTLHTSSGQMTLKNPVDDLMLGILSEISQYDNRIRAERSRLGRFQKVQQGNWKGGPPPFGYHIDNKQLVIDQFESEWVLKIYDWYCLGISVKDIQSRLNANGVMTRRGNTQWSLGSIQQILRNVVYAGHYNYTDKMVGKTVRIESPVIVDPHLFQSAQTKRTASNSRKNQINPTKHFYLLRGLLVCGHCGTPMGGRINKAGHQNFYYCVMKERSWKTRGDDHQKWKRGNLCSMVRSVNIACTDHLVWGMVKRIIQDEWMLKETINEDRPSLKVLFDGGKGCYADDIAKDISIKCKDTIDSIDIIQDDAGSIMNRIYLSPMYQNNNQSPVLLAEPVEVLTADNIDKLTNEQKKIVLSQTVDKITVYFDKAANKHRVDVEFTSSFSSSLPRSSTKLEYADNYLKPIGDQLMAICINKEIENAGLSGNKPMVRERAFASVQQHSVTVE